jgi:signal transduction histidine kinase
VQVAGARQHVSALGEKNLSLPELGSNQNQVQIEFVGLSFALGEVIRYQYKIEGVDVDWSTPTEQRTVNYANLAPRTYRFFVRAVNSSGRVSVETASVLFTIPPPIWRRWWFVFLAVMLVGLIAYKLIRDRVNRLVEVANIRAHIAADLHDDIGSSLSQIAVLSEVLRKQLGRQEAAVSKNISLINRVSQETLDSISDIVWAINPQQDHLNDLVRKMRRVASEVLPARDIEFRFDAPGAVPDLRLGAEIRRQVFLMFKEAINNLVRHSQCTRAEIELKIEGMWLLLNVVDNGAGFDPDGVRDGNGLVSLRRRASALGGQTIVSSTRGQGTTVRIKVPHILRRRHQSRNHTRPTNNQPGH